MKKLLCLVLSMVAVFSAVPVFAEGTQAVGTNEMLMSFMPFIVLIVVFYFFLIRPQKKKEKETRDMLNALVPGDEIVTIGGVIGKIVKVKENAVVIETGSDKVKLTFERGAIGRVTKKNEREAAKAESEANKALEQEKAEKAEKKDNE